MASNPTLALQKAFFDTLSGSGFQVACGVSVGVYDHVPAAAQAPYVVISNIQVDGAVAQGYNASDVHAALTVYSTKPGKVELQAIAGSLRDFLAPVAAAGAARVPPFTLIGHRLVTWQFLQAVPMDEPDGVTTKAVVTIEYQTEPLS